MTIFPEVNKKLGIFFSMVVNEGNKCFLCCFDITEVFLMQVLTSFELTILEGTTFKYPVNRWNIDEAYEKAVGS